MNQPTKVADTDAFRLIRTVAVLVGNGLPAPNSVTVWDGSILVAADNFTAWAAELDTDPPEPNGPEPGSSSIVWSTPRTPGGIRLQVVTWNDDEIRVIGARPPKRDNRREPLVAEDGEWSIHAFDDQPIADDKERAADLRVEVRRHDTVVREFTYPAYRIWTLLAHWTEELDDLAADLARVGQQSAASV